ncbi:RNA polymerase sigma factor [Microlunatus parietis]|uniref:RNA polymerase sigma factor (Sigma-70 family) n=1 Tax=Microlunatus parietis TaxID=682979 RepID=A0A7Y9I7S6_9ACTN|nr:sigma-70 family RNA polymerase sigma factor [Microlunatus parietis]NYE71767.1 RNA polymerase sigma factor (sigma-70 family) [Microlunatus parietis]
MPQTTGFESLLREIAPQALGALTRRYGRFDLCEDAVQEALLAAATQWPESGVPDNPAAWLTTVAGRKLTDLLRSEQSRRQREQREFVREVPMPSPAPDTPRPEDRDDTLITVFLCCHPDLKPPSQIALTLRAVGGLTTAEIARGLMIPETTVGQRITRAKQRILESGARFRMPEPKERDKRLAAVLQVLYLIFNEGYTASSGPDLQRVELADEAIRLTRLLWSRLPDEPEVGGLLALMLITASRQDTRTGPAGELIPLGEQDRSRWDRTMITEGVGLLEQVLPRQRPGSYQLQAAIAACHAEAERYEDTDWPQIAALYGVLDRMSDDRMVTLNRAVAVAMADGPVAGLALIDGVADHPQLAGHHRLFAVRAHLLEQDDQPEAAQAAYQEAARLTLSQVERRYLQSRAARLADG